MTANAASKRRMYCLRCIILGLIFLARVGLGEESVGAWGSCGSSHIAMPRSAWRDLLTSIETSIFGRGVARVMISEVTGEAILTTREKREMPPLMGQTMFSGDEIRVPDSPSKKNSVTLWLSEGHNVKILPGGRIRITLRSSHQSKGLVDLVEVELLEGDLRCVRRGGRDPNPSQVEIKTPTAGIGIRGTDFFVSHSDLKSSTQVVVFSGQVEVWGVKAVSRHSRFLIGGQTIEVTSQDPGLAGAFPRALLREEVRAFEEKSR